MAKATLEVLEEIQFRYPEDQRYRYVIPEGLSLLPDEAWCLSGVSGSGKSTLMTLLSTLRRFQQGRLRFAFSSGRTIEVTPQTWERAVGPSLWQRIGFAFQRPELIRALTVADNLALAAAPGEIGAADECRSALFTAGEWQRIRGSRVWKISGGQIQRLGLARAFGHDQDLVFLDEPTNNLDVRNRQGVAEYVQAERQNRALVVVSHDEDFLHTLRIDRFFHIEEQPDADGGIRRVLREAGAADDVPADKARPELEHSPPRLQRIHENSGVYSQGSP